MRLDDSRPSISGILMSIKIISKGRPASSNSYTFSKARFPFKAVSKTALGKCVVIRFSRRIKLKT